MADAKDINEHCPPGTQEKYNVVEKGKELECSEGRVPPNINELLAPVVQTEAPVTQKKGYNNVPYIPGMTPSQQETTSYTNMDLILEKEKLHNKGEPWNKLDKTVKIQKLHAFAEKYGKDHSLPTKEIKLLKVFFVECLEKNKLQKAKDVTYNQDSKELSAIPSLHFNSEKKNFTLKIADPKRVSTLKSLTPKRQGPEIKLNI
jgi:hypothetical protein